MFFRRNIKILDDDDSFPYVIFGQGCGIRGAGEKTDGIFVFIINNQIKSIAVIVSMKFNFYKKTLRNLYFWPFPN